MVAKVFSQGSSNSFFGDVALFGASAGDSKGATMEGGEPAADSEAAGDIH